ncbi:sodium:solute symporter family transporter [Escherichia coli]
MCSSAITEDLYKAFLRKHASQKELVWVGRVMVLVVALVAIALAANPENRVLGLVSYAWAGFWRGVWSGGAVLGDVVTHDAQRCAGGDDHRCADGYRLEAVRLAGTLRNYSGLHLRQYRDCSVLVCWVKRRQRRCKNALPRPMRTIIRLRRHGCRKAKGLSLRRFLFGFSSGLRSLNVPRHIN